MTFYIKYFKHEHELLGYTTDISTYISWLAEEKYQLGSSLRTLVLDEEWFNNKYGKFPFVKLSNALLRVMRIKKIDKILKREVI